MRVISSNERFCVSWAVLTNQCSSFDNPPRYFLAVANHGGDAVTKEFGNSTITIKNQITSTVYEFNSYSRSFEELQNIETNGFVSTLRV